MADDVVRRISEIISVGLYKNGASYVRRSVDEFARIAGGTFAFHFPSETEEESLKRLESLCSVISEHASFRELDGSRFKVTVSARFVTVKGEYLPLPETEDIAKIGPGYYSGWSESCLKKLNESARSAIPNTVASISPDFLPVPVKSA